MTTAQNNQQQSASELEPLPPVEVERALGETELSYFLPSREDGVNDSYLHLGCTAPSRLVTPARIRAAWALSRLRHPPLAAHVCMEPGDYSSARFVYAPPRGVSEALAQAEAALEFSEEDKDVLIDRYLNGPRLLSADRLAYLFVGCVPGQDRNAPRPSVKGPGGLPTPALALHLDTAGQAQLTIPQAEAHDDIVRNFDFMICTTHYLGDGMALHRFMNEFFQLTAGQVDGGPPHERSAEEIEAMLAEEWEKTWGAEALRKGTPDLFPPHLEDALPTVPGGRLRRAADEIDFQSMQNKLIGGHAFPRTKGKPRHMIVKAAAYDENHTSVILRTCKVHGVSIANAIFALSALSWSRMRAKEPGVGELPIMMYTALNLRPYLLASATAHRSYWFTAIGYLNIVLPAFLPAVSSASSTVPSTAEVEKEDKQKIAPEPPASANSTSSDPAVARTFWHRARLCKAQISATTNSPMFISRTRAMALSVPLISAASSESSTSVPSTALLGLSMLGNLDSIYQHPTYPSVRLHTLTPGARRRPGGILLYAYTFAGKLRLCLDHDVNGFEEGVVERWWTGVLGGVEEFLVVRA